MLRKLSGEISQKHTKKSGLTKSCKQAGLVGWLEFLGNLRKFWKFF